MVHTTTSLDQEKLRVRWINHGDTKAVLSIENDCFDAPWSERRFSELMRQQNVAATVATYNEQVIGYLFCELGEINCLILNIAVAGGWRRLGIGTALLNSRIERMGRYKGLRRYLLVDAEDETRAWFRIEGVAQFFEKIGFKRCSEVDVIPASLLQKTWAKHGCCGMAQCSIRMPHEELERMVLRLYVPLASNVRKV